MKVGVLYIATGRYTIFWQDFYQSAERYLLPEDEKYYFVFTDSELPLLGEETGKVTRVFQEKLGWPYDTLMRFDMFLKAKESLLKMNYLFFFNANMEIVQRIDRHELGLEILHQSDVESQITQQNQPTLIAVKHPGFSHISDNTQFTYERDPQSLAYIPIGEGEHYVMGGLNGGIAKYYLNMAETLNERIHQDMNCQRIAVWHDESHLNHYFYHHRNQFVLLSDKYGFPEEWFDKHTVCHEEFYDKKFIQERDIKIVLRDKSHYRFGGGVCMVAW